MLPNNLTPTELVRYARNMQSPTEWELALANALEDEIGASEDLQKELEDANDTITSLRGDIGELQSEFNEEEEKRLGLEYDIEQVRNELEEYRRNAQDAI